MKKLLLAVCLAFLGTQAFSAPDAQAWTHTGYFTRVIVLGHNFDRVTVTASGCYLHFTVYFNAPYYKYQSDYHMNYYRFQAKVTLGTGAWIRTPVFYNSAPGRREYTYTHNTSDQGCWAVRYSRVSYLVVHGCQGRSCYVRPIDSGPNRRTTNTWTDTGYFTNLWVKGYQFSSLTANNLSYNPCKMMLKISFTSPTSYRHNMRATVTLGRGYRAKTITSPLFYNAGYGNREYTFYYDTTPYGCWGSSFRKVAYLHVQVW